MHFYLCDQGNIPTNHFEKQLINLQSLLAEFRITGEFHRTSPLKSTNSLVEHALSRGAKTIVICGSDQSFNHALAHMNNLNTVFAYIPLIENTITAKILGISSLFEAVKTIAARRIETVDVALCNNFTFFNGLEFGIMSKNISSLSWWSTMKALSVPTQSIKVRIDDSYDVQIQALGGQIVNSRGKTSNINHIANPTDGLLDLLVIEKLSRMDIIKNQDYIRTGEIEKLPGTSNIKFKQLDFLEPQRINLTMHGLPYAKTPVGIKISKSQLKLIVGKNRTF